MAGMIVAPQPEAAEAGAQILRRGGNAVDAAIAAAFVQGVADPLMAGVAAKWGCPVILMHNRSKPSNAEIQSRLGGRYIGVTYNDLLNDVKQELLESVSIARAAGVRDDQIILDPGIGFGKTVEQNLELVNHLGEIKELGYPVLLGASRKSFIGYTLNLPPEERVEGTAAVCAEAIAAAQPGTFDELSAVKGVGPVKVQRYGRTILDLLAGETA